MFQTLEAYARGLLSRTVLGRPIVNPWDKSFVEASIRCDAWPHLDALQREQLYL